MPDLFDGPDASEGEFSLPGDAELLAATTEGQALAEEQAAEETQEPDPVSEAARLLRSQRDKPEEEAPSDLDEAADQEEQPVATDPAAELLEKYLAKYDGDMDKALKAAANQDSLLGRQAQELGEARQAIEQWNQWAQHQQAQAAQQAQPQGIAGWEDFIAENPAQAAQQAYAQGNEAAYQAAVREWEEISPGAPQNWYDNMQIKGALQQQQQQQEYATREAAGMEAINQVVSRHPDLPDLVDRMVEIAPQYPHELMALASGNLNIAAPAMESLYLKARGATSDTLANTAQEIARRQTEEEMRVRQEASVASATRTGSEPPMSAAEEIASGWANDDELSSGWNIGRAAS